ncbi:glycoside hydrolase family 108 protein [Gracilimonas sp. Q87]|uniref:glycoside hydrolase family 108 protein n=1 Tax=Gracilimonas sp. Q87 TaxID=3384766 RepID=UPI0039842F0F
MFSAEVFRNAFDHLILVEGGYVDNPYDSGGKTMYGITESVARENGFSGDMRDLNLDFARTVYKRKYWDVNNLDNIGAFDPKIAKEMFESGVNAGPNRVAKWLQKTLNLLNRRATLYKNLIVDGDIGSKTLNALAVLYDKDDLHSVEVLLNGYQMKHYIDISEKNEELETFIRGWIKRVHIDGI